MDREEDWSKKGRKQMSVVFQGFLEDGGGLRKRKGEVSFLEGFDVIVLE